MYSIDFSNYKGKDNFFKIYDNILEIEIKGLKYIKMIIKDKKLIYFEYLYDVYIYYYDQKFYTMSIEDIQYIKNSNINIEEYLDNCIFDTQSDYLFKLIFGKIKDYVEYDFDKLVI